MDSIIKIAVVVLAFCAGFTVGQGHYPLDFDGSGSLTGNDVNVALQHLKIKK